MSNSKFKSNRGGSRPGAGRKSNKAKALALKTAKQILTEADANFLWRDLLIDGNSSVRLKALIFLHEQAFGKAIQSVQLSGNPDDDTPISVSVDL